MQSVSSRIWTRIIMSISYDDNHYTTGTSKNVYLLKKKKCFVLYLLLIYLLQNKKPEWTFSK